jgi:putative transposase
MLSTALFRTALAAYINGLSFRALRASCSNLARLCQLDAVGISHDALQRLLACDHDWSSELLQHSAERIAGKRGWLIIDDTVLAKPFSRKLAMLSRHWSSSDRRYLTGINCVLVIWTDGDTRVPVAARLYENSSGRSKLDLAIEMLQQVHRLLKPHVDYVLFDSWYAATKLLKQVRHLGWHWVTRLKSNRKLDGTRADEFFRYRYGHATVRLSHGEQALAVKHDGIVLASSDTSLSLRQLKRLYKQRQWVEELIKILKSHLSIESCSARSQTAHRSHIHLCLLAFCRLEQERLRHGIATIYRLREMLFNCQIPSSLAWNLALPVSA